MSSPFPPAVLRAFIENKEQTAAPIKAKIRELLPNLTEAQLARADAHVEQYEEILFSFLREGSLEAVRPRMAQMTQTTTQTGLRIDTFVRIIFEAMARNKNALVKVMPCEPEALLDIFSRLDEYERTLFDEFAKAQREYWERRERDATELQTSFFNHLLFPAITGTPDLIIRAVNPALMASIPVHPDQIIGISVDDWLQRVGLSKRVIERLMAKFEERGELVQEEVTIRGASPGSTLALMLSMNYMVSNEGRKLGFQAMIEDMTEKRALQRRIASQMAEMDAVFESTPVGLIFVDSSRTIRRMNQSTRRLLGFSLPEKFVEANTEDFRKAFRENFKNPEGLMKVLDEVYSDSESSKRGVFETLNPPRTIRYSVTPVHDELGVAIGWLWIFTDISQLVANQKLRNDLTHMIVHDLKNPLTSIRGGVYLLKDKATAEEAKAEQAIELVQRNCDRMMDMIMNLLDIERLESGKLKLTRALLPIVDFLHTVIESQRHAAGTRELTLEIAPELRSVEVSADGNLLERVLVNLISNAIKHTRANGHITLGVCQGDGGETRLSVKDDGAGIPREFHDKIFEKFGQAELRREGHKTDTGLGLTFCKLATEAHGGRITVQSEPGKGSTFTITIPRRGEAPSNANPNDSGSWLVGVSRIG